MKKILAGIGLAVLSSDAFSQQAMYLDGSSLACISANSWNRQDSYINQGIEKIVDGCFVTNQKLRIILLETIILNPTRVELVDNGQEIWIDKADLAIK